MFSIERGRKGGREWVPVGKYKVVLLDKNYITTAMF